MQPVGAGPADAESWFYRTAGRAARSVMGGVALTSYGDHYTHLSNAYEDGYLEEAFHDTAGFEDAHIHTWYLCNSEVRQIGEFFSQTPNGFELVGDQYAHGFCRILPLDLFYKQLASDVSGAVEWNHPRKEMYYYIANTRDSKSGGEHWVSIAVELEKKGNGGASTARQEAPTAAPGAVAMGV